MREKKRTKEEFVLFKTNIQQQQKNNILKLVNIFKWSTLFIFLLFRAEEKI